MARTSSFDFFVFFIKVFTLKMKFLASPSVMPWAFPLAMPRESAEKAGLSSMSLDEINAEIAASRADRRARKTEDGK